jgi:alpha,alpha-trehalase
VALVLLACHETPAPRSRAAPGPEEDLRAIRAYIRNGWTELRRTHRQLLAAAIDPKLGARGPDHRWPVYVSEREDLAAIEATLRAEMPAADFARIELRRLPADPATLAEHGILYLPAPYVVPGGRFNEMYGWDSYFIVVGLLRDGEVELATGMVDNFLYEIDRYGMILNANRTYYLSRSQPPFLTTMLLDVYEKTHDRAWLAAALPAIEKYHGYWTREPHLTPATGLSRYHDLGSGPAPEVLSGERDEEGHTHYDRVQAWYRANRVDDYDVSLFYDAAQDRLTDLFYVADRSMRESGFDPSNRFGAFNIGVIHYDPVCLNTLLYRMEQETARILEILDRGEEARPWEERAEARKATMQRLLWDDEAGLFLDYDFVHERRRPYPFATTFFPLWAGLATPEQARRVVSGLARFEAPGGIRTSTVRTGNQWDAPYGWAPLQLVAVEGLRRYGFDEEADRISVAFLSLVLQEFREHHAIFEKYDVEARQSATASGIRFGYSSNEIGFGWTNAAFTEMWAALPGSRREEVALRAGAHRVGRAR